MRQIVGGRTATERRGRMVHTVKISYHQKVPITNIYIYIYTYAPESLTQIHYTRKWLRVRLENSNWGDEERFHMSFIMLMGFRVVVWRNYFHLISYVYININCIMFAEVAAAVA